RPVTEMPRGPPSGRLVSFSILRLSGIVVLDFGIVLDQSCRSAFAALRSTCSTLAAPNIVRRVRTLKMPDTNSALLQIISWSQYFGEPKSAMINDMHECPGRRKVATGATTAAGIPDPAKPSSFAGLPVSRSLCDGVQSNAHAAASVWA